MGQTPTAQLAIGLVVFCVCPLVACVDRARVNASCEWSDDWSGPLDLRRAADRRHLHDDAVIAEELGIRLGDSFRGAKDISERRRMWAACTDSVFAMIVRTHGVAIEEARGAALQRNPLVDIVLVLLPMLAVLWWAAAASVDRVRHRFLPDEPALALSFTLFLSLAMSGLWWVVGEQWSWLVEMLRLRNQHISYRAERLPWYSFGIPLFLSGVVLVGWIAWRRWRRESRAA
jgi:hypothetical protein